MAGATAIGEQEKPQPRAGRFAPGVSGNPRGGALDRVKERAIELFSAMAPEFGELSGVDSALLRQACLLLARCERMRRVRDADASVRLSSEARRIIEALRRHAPAKSRGSSLQQYLASKYGESAADEVVVDDPAEDEAVAASKIATGESEGVRATYPAAGVEDASAVNSESERPIGDAEGDEP